MSFLRFPIGILAFARSVNRTTIATAPTRGISRWVGPTLRELRKRAKKIGLQECERRSNFVEWNYRSEIFAFSKRLHEEFDLSLLKTAFTHRSFVTQEEINQRELGIEADDIAIQDNRELAQRGEYLTKLYIKKYMHHTLPKMPPDGQNVLTLNLLNTTRLANTALQLGTKDLIFSSEYPPNEDTLSRTLLAVIGALEKSASTERAFLFIRDFICTHLNQCDILDLWNIDNPQALLRQVCCENKLGEPEPRLIGDCAKNDILAVYQVGMYVEKKMIGKGFGEDISTATKVASLDSLQTLFAIPNNIRPFDFQLQMEAQVLNTTQN